MTTNKQPAAMTTFVIIWMGQIVSLLGTSMTAFGLAIWAFEQTNQATTLTLIEFFFVIPLLFVSPVAGVIIDRSSRKLMMMLPDLASGLVTVAILGLFAADRLAIWHLYAAAAIQGTFQTFQWPAFSAAITMMLPKEHYTRANSMMELAGYGANVLAPLLAGALLGLLGAGRGLRVILLIDVVSFTFAIGTVLFAHIPQPKTSDAGREAGGHFWQEALYGLRYILRQPSLLGLQLLLMTGHFFDTVAFTLLAPMILARTGNDEMLFGVVQTLGAIGGIVGGVVVSAWGGFRRRIHGVLLGWTFTSLFGTILMGLGRGAPAWMGLPIWGAGLLLGEVCFPLINGSNEAIWQAKVPPDVQGRVFSYRRVLSWITAPLAIFITGPLADRVMEPAMREGGALAGTFGWLVGTGPGAGMSLIFVFGGILVALIMASGYLFPVIRDIEDLLPDHDMGEEETT